MINDIEFNSSLEKIKIYLQNEELNLEEIDKRLLNLNQEIEIQSVNNLNKELNNNLKCCVENHKAYIKYLESKFMEYYDVIKRNENLLSELTFNIGKGEK